VLNTLEKYYNDGLLNKQTHPTLDLTIWNYSPKVQYERLWDDITLQCRGLVTNSKGDIVARPFKKFFNYEEHKLEDIPNENYEVYEKMDGSLGILFNYKNEWIMVTRGSFTSEQSIKGKELLEKYNFKRLHTDYTYLFEIIYKENRIVCDYDYDDIVLLGMIETKSGNEVNIHNGNEDIRFQNMISNIGFPVVMLYKTWNESYDLLKEEIQKDREGYVIRFKNGFRMKIKGEEYKRLHKLLTGISSRDIWEHLKDDRPLDDIIKDVPDEFYDWVKETSEDLKNQFDTILDVYTKIFNDLTKQNLERKDFALKAKSYSYSNILFNMLDGSDPKQNIWKILYPDYSKPFKKDEN